MEGRIQTQRLTHLLPRLGAFKAALILVLLVSSSAFADPIVFNLSGQGNDGENLAARVSFDLSGSTLTVILTNTATFAANNNGDVLTAVFFNSNGTLSPLNAILTSGSTVVNGGSTDPGGGVGGEWVFRQGLIGAPNNATAGISSSGLSELFGTSDTYFGPAPGSNLYGPKSPDGLQYGVLSSAGEVCNGGSPCNVDPLIMDSVTFTVNVSGGFSLNSISNVSAQYGTQLSEPCIGACKSTPAPVPEPAGFVLLGTGLVGLFVLRRSKAKH